MASGSRGLSPDHSDATDSGHCVAGAASIPEWRDAWSDTCMVVDRIFNGILLHEAVALTVGNVPRTMEGSDRVVDQLSR